MELEKLIAPYGMNCALCQDYPCRRLKQLNLRYVTKYKMSMIENLDYIQQYGLTAFIEQQNKKYKCENCGRLKTVYQDYCIYCVQEKIKE